MIEERTPISNLHEVSRGNSVLEPICDWTWVIDRSWKVEPQMAMQRKSPLIETVALASGAIVEVNVELWVSYLNADTVRIESDTIAAGRRLNGGNAVVSSCCPFV